MDHDKKNHGGRFNEKHDKNNNISVSRYSDKKNKKGKNFVQSNKNRLFSPQHKIITSIKKKKYLDDSV